MSNANCGLGEQCISTVRHRRFIHICLITTSQHRLVFADILTYRVRTSAPYLLAQVPLLHMYLGKERVLHESGLQLPVLPLNYTAL